MRPAGLVSPLRILAAGTGTRAALIEHRRDPRISGIRQRDAEPLPKRLGWDLQAQERTTVRSGGFPTIEAKTGAPTNSQRPATFQTIAAPQPGPTTGTSGQRRTSPQEQRPSRTPQTVTYVPQLTAAQHHAPQPSDKTEPEEDLLLELLGEQRRSTDTTSPPMQQRTGQLTISTRRGCKIVNEPHQAQAGSQKHFPEISWQKKTW